MSERSHSSQILVVLALTNLVAYAARNALFAVYPDLGVQFHIDDAQIGLLQTIFMIPHAIATLPFGWAGDRYDRRRVIAVGMVISSVAAAAGAIGTDYHWLAISRGLVGLGTAAVVPIANSILGQVFDGPKKAARLSIFNLGLFLGGVLGFVVGMQCGFPLVVVVLAAPGLVLAALVARLPVPAHPGEPPTEVWWRYLAGFMRLFAGEAHALLRIRTLRWLIASTTAMAFAAGGFNAWLKEFLTREKHLSDHAATNLLVLAMCGGLAGILTGGRISDHLRQRVAAGRLWTIVIGIAVTVPCAAASIVVPAGPALYVLGVLTLFFSCWYHAPMAASVDDLAPPGKSVSAQGLVIFTMHLVGTAPSSWIVGEVSLRTSLRTAMWVPTGAMVLAAVIMAIASTSFSHDHARARTAPGSSGGGRVASL